MNLIFIVQSILFGAGLAMDAFSVSIANGLREPYMPRGRMLKVAGVYALFQFLMPMTGWVCVHFLTRRFLAFQPWIPRIALILLSIIGGNMLREGITGLKADALSKREWEGEVCSIPEMKAVRPVSLVVLLTQGVATSIDALSAGFTIAEYGPAMAFVCALLIAAVTLIICFWGLVFGKRFGEKLSDKATIVGGLILIAIGLKIFFKP